MKTFITALILSSTTTIASAGGFVPWDDRAIERSGGTGSDSRPVTSASRHLHYSVATAKVVSDGFTRCAIL